MSRAGPPWKSGRLRIALLAVQVVVLVVLLLVDDNLNYFLQRGRDALSKEGYFPVTLLAEDDLWQFFSSFGLWVSGVAIAAAIWQLDPTRRRAVAVLIAGLIVASAATSVMGKTIGRRRPARSEGITTVMPFGKAWYSGEAASFPSGHATFAGGLATFLVLAYPRLRVVAWTMAGGCALARIFFRKHFPADVFAGLLMGYYGMRWTWDWLGPRLDAWLDERARARSGP